MTNALIDPVRLKPLLGKLASRFDIDALPEASSSSDLLLERAAKGRPPVACWWLTDRRPVVAAVAGTGFHRRITA